MAALISTSWLSKEKVAFRNDPALLAVFDRREAAGLEVRARRRAPLVGWLFNGHDITISHP